MVYGSFALHTKFRWLWTTINEGKLKATETFTLQAAGPSRELWDALWGWNWKKLLENMAAAGLLSCSLEATTESIFRNRTAELQRYPKDDELPKTYLTAKLPTDYSLY